MPDEGAVEVSVVVPVLDELGTLEPLADGVAHALAGRRWELVFVDDGSTDGSRERIRALASERSEVRGVLLRGNCGQHAALAAGLEAANGAAVTLIDADLQHDPADLPALLAPLDDGHDLVSGWRRERRDPLFRRLASGVVRWLIHRVTGVVLRDPNCGMKAMRRSLVDAVNEEGDRRRYLAALLPLLSERPAEVPVSHRARPEGRSRYTFLKALALLLDFAIVFGRPLRWVGAAGAAMFAAGALGSLAYGVARVAWLEAGMPRLILLLLLLLGGDMQFVILGFLGEYVVRTHHLVQGRPLFRVEERL